MPNTPDHTALARWLEHRLRQGFEISGEVTAYMEATFGSTDLAVLHPDRADGETDSLLELIFFPDHETQSAYEARWGDHAFTRDQSTDIVAALCAASLQVPLRMPAGGTELTVRPPEFALAAFVQRLHITWRAQAPLVRALGAAWTSRRGLEARVALRNARLAWLPHRVDLAARFLSKATEAPDDADDLLSFLLHLISDLDAETDPFEFFVARKFICFQSLCRAEDFERRRQNANMEIMMLQGHRAAFGSQAQWRDQMRRIDAICRHLFGRTHFFRQPGDQCIDLQGTDWSKQMEDMLHLLS